MKLRNQSITYQVYPETGTVVCVVESCIIFANGFTHSKFITKGIARCSQEDTFDQNIGKKLARARAEKEAFFKFRNVLENVWSDYTKETLNLKQTLEKVNGWITHQREYIKSFQAIWD